MPLTPSPSQISRPPASTRLATGLASLADSYDLVLCDVWGVLHDGLIGFRGARDALIRFRERGGTVLLVSNAPRPGHAVAAQLARFGTGPEAYDGIVTSGDLMRDLVRSRAGEIVCHLGPDRDRPIYDGLDVRFGDHLACDYVVCTGLVNDDTETPEDYAALLREMRGRDLWMLCANPDIVVERGEQLLYCAGALAAAYEDLGGETFYAGKPHVPVYDTALTRAASLRGEPLDRRRVLAIGDAIRTDIAGAAGVGIDTLLIARGIHAAALGFEAGTLDLKQALAWLSEQPVRPTMLTGELTWTGTSPAEHPR